MLNCNTTINENIEKILIDENEIKNAVKQLGKRISADYNGKDLLLVGVLKGAFVFLSDLMREIEFPCGVDFIVAKSYGMNAVSGDLKIIKDIEQDISGRHVILVEDILDTAATLSSLAHILSSRNPASLKTAAFLDKKIERTIKFEADYKCFDIENEFVVGYGLDYAEMFRNLPYVGVVKRELYMK